MHLNRGKNIDLEVAKRYIEEAGRIGIERVFLSGGETMLYPNLYELISLCKKNKIDANIAISGWGFDKVTLEKLVKSGVKGIYVSLNGSNKKINSITRNGYELAINALSILRNSKFREYYINWVAYKHNIDDFPNMINLCKQYDVKEIFVLAAKPDSKNEIKNIPSYEQTIKLANLIKNINNTNIGIEKCYNFLRLYTYGDLLKNNFCAAGRVNFSISVDGKFTPCRHIEYKENYKSIYEYWNNSEFLNKLRKSDEPVVSQCKTCEYNGKCIPCAAINYKIHGKISRGNEYCVQS